MEFIDFNKLSDFKVPSSYCSKTIDQKGEDSKNLVKYSIKERIRKVEIKIKELNIKRSPLKQKLFRFLSFTNHHKVKKEFLEKSGKYIEELKELERSIEIDKFIIKVMPYYKFIFDVNCNYSFDSIETEQVPYETTEERQVEYIDQEEYKDQEPYTYYEKQGQQVINNSVVDINVPKTKYRWVKKTRPVTRYRTETVPTTKYREQEKNHLFY